MASLRKRRKRVLMDQNKEPMVKMPFTKGNIPPMITRVTRSPSKPIKQMKR